MPLRPPPCDAIHGIAVVPTVPAVVSPAASLPMRRLIVEEPLSQAAVWSRRLGWFALLVAAAGVLLTRLQLVEWFAGLSVIASAVALALLALALSVTALVFIWQEGQQGLALAVRGGVLALVVLGWPAFLGFKAVVLPRMNDISTDVVDPPAFSRSAQVLAARAGHVPREIATDERLPQRDAYADVVPIYAELSPEDALSVAERTARTLGWEIAEVRQPGGRTGRGQIDAVDHTLLLRFPDDIAIRVTPRAEGTKVDVRSVSRYGVHDFGVNAERIARFIAEFELQARAAQF